MAGRVTSSRGVGGPSTLSSPDFIGRAAEMATLEHALIQPAAVVLVEGEAGVGKSRLVQEFTASVSGQRHRMLTAVCPPFRQPYTLGPLVDAVRQATDGVTELTLSALGGALRPLFPEWAADLPPMPEPAEDVRATRHRLFRALAELLDCLDVAVLIVEDVHWADDATLEFLLLLASRQARTPSLLMTYRPEDVPPDSLILRLSSRAPAGTTRVRVSVEALDVTETAQLVSSMLAGEHVSDAFARFVHERTDGLPLAVEESVRLMHGRADLSRRNGEWVRRSLAEIDVPPTVRDAVLERVGRLDPAAHAVLRAAAVLAEPASEATLLAVTGLEAGPVHAGLSAALECRLLAEGGRLLYSFRHALAARAVYESMSAPLRWAMHRRAGHVLEATSPLPATQLARHFREAGDTPNWCRYAEQAADLALAAADEAAAIALLHDLITSAELPAATMARLAHKIPLSSFIGRDRFADVVRRFRSVLDTSALVPIDEANLRFQLGRVLTVMEEYEAGRAEVERAIPGLPNGSVNAARAMILLGWARNATWPARAHQQWLQRAAKTSAHLEHGERMDIEIDTVVGLLLLGEESAWIDAARISDGATSGADARRVARANLNIGDLAMRWGHFAQARRRLDNAFELAGRNQYLRYRDVIAATLVHLDWFTGAWDGLAERAAAIDAADMQWVTALESVLVTGLLLAANGDNAAAREHFERALAATGQHGAVECTMEPAAALAKLYLADGLVDDALRVTDEPMQIVVQKRIWLWATDLAAPRVSALAAAGRLAEATELVTAFAQWLDGRDAPAPRAALIGCQAILAEARGEHAVAATLYDDAAAAWQALPRPYDALLAREAQARCLISADEREAGLSLLADVHDRLTALGAVSDAERATRVLREHGVVTRRVWRGGRRGYGNQLSPRELEVVRLVASGKTNREIAEILFRSPKTVETQLKSAMRKLDVTSRTALAVSAVESGLEPA